MVATSFGEIQHYWVVVDEYVCDPTAQQLDVDQFFFENNNEFYLKYNAALAEWSWVWNRKISHFLYI